MTFENIVAKGEIAYNVQYLFLPQFFQLFSIIKYLFMEIFYIFAKAVCCSCVVCGKGLILPILYKKQSSLSCQRVMNILILEYMCLLIFLQ